jgi:SH3 domain protein
LLGILLVTLCHDLLADIKYVTDDLQLALFEQPNSKGKLLQKLSSGTRLEVIKTKGLFAKVRTPDGTVGWTKAGFLITEKPARARLIEVEQELTPLKQKLEQSQKELKNASEVAAKLRAEKIQVALELAEERESGQNDTAKIDQLQLELDQLKLQSGPAPAHHIPWYWGLIGIGVGLIMGLLGGIALFDWLSRRRHGGYRIY